MIPSINGDRSSPAALTRPKTLSTTVNRSIMRKSIETKTSTVRCLVRSMKLQPQLRQEKRRGRKRKPKVMVTFLINFHARYEVKIFIDLQVSGKQVKCVWSSFLTAFRAVTTQASRVTSLASLPARLAHCTATAHCDRYTTATATKSSELSRTLCTMQCSL